MWLGCDFPHQVKGNPGLMTTSDKRFIGRSCGVVLPAWLSAAQRPNGALLLGHLSQQHPGEVGAYLARMHTTEDITPVSLPR
jgi:hypothetical protein